MSNDLTRQLGVLRQEIATLRSLTTSLLQRQNRHFSGYVSAFHSLDGLRFEHPDLRELQLARLILLRRFAALCEELDLEYFLHDGTLLGAVRHQGYIPWDDDLDVAMTRPHYERLCSAVAGRSDCKLFEVIVAAEASVFARFLIGDCDPYFYLDIFILDWCEVSSIPDFLRTLDERQRTLALQIRQLMQRHCPGQALGRPLSIGLPAAPADRFHAELTQIMDAHRTALCGPEALTSGNCLASLGEFIRGTRFAVEAEAVYPLQRLHFEDRDHPVPADCETYLRRRYGDWRHLPDDAGSITHALNFDVELMKRIREFIRCHGG